MSDRQIPWSRSQSPQVVEPTRRFHGGKSRVGVWPLLGVISAVLLAPVSSRAIDTVEPFEKGASDVELYFGGEGFGRSSHERSLGASFQLGYGVTEKLSLYVNGTATSNTFLRGANRSLGLGVYGTVLDEGHVQVDLFLDLGLSGHQLSEATVSPGFELTVELGHLGVFLTAFEAMSGRERSEEGHAAQRLEERVFDTELTVGGLWNVAQGHQLLLACAVTAHHVPQSGQDGFETEGIGVGYNVMVHENIELINEVMFHLPRGEQALGVAVSTGFIVTL